MAYDKSDIVPPSLKNALEAVISGGKWFEFDQNNSGGYFRGPAKRVFIEAADSEAAYTILSEQEDFTTSYCGCCGHRWYGSDEITHEEMAEKLMRLADPQNYSNRHSDSDTIPTALIVPLATPNKAQKEPFTLAAFVAEVLAATGEAFEQGSKD
jgi:hypothetical protein